MASIHTDFHQLATLSRRRDLIIVLNKAKSTLKQQRVKFLAMGFVVAINSLSVYLDFFGHGSVDIIMGCINIAIVIIAGRQVDKAYKEIKLCKYCIKYTQDTIYNRHMYLLSLGREEHEGDDGDYNDY